VRSLRAAYDEAIGKVRKSLPIAPVGRPIVPAKVDWIASEFLKTRLAHGYIDAIDGDSFDRDLTPYRYGGGGGGGRLRATTTNRQEPCPPVGPGVACGPRGLPGDWLWSIFEPGDHHAEKPGGVMSYPPREPKPRKEKPFLGRTVVIIGILGTIASIVAVAWAILHREDKGSDGKDMAGEYRNQVLATCEQVHKILTTEHNEIFTFDPSGGGTSPNELVRVNKDLLLQVLQNNLTQSRIVFDELNKKPVPGELNGQHASAVKAQNDWYASFEQLIKAVREKLPRNPTLTKVLELGTLTGSQDANTRVNSAMTALAGKNCQVTG
jgi:hypothetical protein